MKRKIVTVPIPPTPFLLPLPVVHLSSPYSVFSIKVLVDLPVELILGLHYVPAATLALLVRNVVHHGILAIFRSMFKFFLGLAKFSHGLSRYT